MNGYEIVLFIWLTLLTIGFSFVIVEMLDRTKKLKDTLTKLYSYVHDDLYEQIKIVRQLVLDEIINKKEDASTNKVDQDRMYNGTYIIKSDKFSYAPEKRYTIHDPCYDRPGHEPEVKDVCVIVEVDENNRPYFSIRYMTNDNVCHVRYGSYKLEIALLLLKDYFKCKE